jgi:hypothetical protein
MNSAGEIEPRVGCSQRSSASALVMRPLARSYFGWKFRRSSPGTVSAVLSAESSMKPRWLALSDCGL